MTNDRQAGNPVTAPRVFISYRRADWLGPQVSQKDGELLIDLTDRLREDLGDTMVFRDKEDMVAGEPWEDAVEEAVVSADALVVLAGPEWWNQLGKPNDMASREVTIALDPANRTTPVPVLIDLSAEEKPKLPEEIARLDRYHWDEVTKAGLRRSDSVDYQRILVATWATLLRTYDDPVLVIGSHVREIEVKRFTEALKGGEPLDARALSQIGAGVFVISLRYVRSKRNKWPSVIVLADSSSDEGALRSLGIALRDHPRFRDIALVGSGVLGTSGVFSLNDVFGGSDAATQLASQAQSFADPSTFFTGASSQSGSATGGASTAGGASTSSGGAAATASSTSTGLASAAGMSLGAKLAAGVVALGVIGGGAAAIIDTTDKTAFGVPTSQTVNVAEDIDERFYPLGEPDAVRIELGPESATTETGLVGPDIEYVSHSLSVRMPGGSTHDLGSVVLPVELPDFVSDSLGDGVVIAQAFGVVDDHSMVDQGTSNNCYRIDDPSIVVAGYRYVDAPLSLQVSILALPDGDGVKGGFEVLAEGEAERIFIEDPGDANLSQCPSIEPDATSVWSE